MSTDVSENHVASIFKVEEQAKQETSTNQVLNKQDMFLYHVG
jgi:hypothetical protein